MKFNQASALSAYNKIFLPHEGQKEVGQALFSQKYKTIFVNCGRKWGKTECGVALCWLWALMYPNSEIYYLVGTQKLAKELVWANRRMQTCCTSDKPDLIHKFNDSLSKVIESINNTEMRIRFKNGSFIKVDGSDDFNNQRGWKPDLVIADEYRDFRREWFETMSPNLNVKPNATMLILTTPPSSAGHVLDLMKYCENGSISIGDPKYTYMSQPSNKNDRIPNHIEKIESEKARLMAKGEYDVFCREYLAEFVVGGSCAILPMITKKLIESHDKIVNEIKGDLHKLEWFVVFDPGNITCFGILFAAINPYTSEIYILDSIKETQTSQTFTSKIWPRTQEIMQELYPDSDSDDWSFICDSHPPSFRAEMSDRYGIHMQHPNKKVVDREECLSQIKDLAITKKLRFSEKAMPLIIECEGYIRNDRGQIPKKDDHLIDCLRYLIMESGYTYTPKEREVAEDPDVLDVEAIRNRKSPEQQMEADCWNTFGHTSHLEDNDCNLF